MKRIKQRLSVLVSLILFSIISSCITIMPSRKNDDGSTSLTREDSLHLAKFDIQYFNKEQMHSSDGGSVFQEIDGNDINSVLGKNKYTWIVLWATWCPHSYADVPRVLQFYNDRLKEKNINMLLVTQDYNLKRMNKTLDEINYTKQSYILSAGKYKTDEWGKVVQVKKEVCKECPVRNVSPQHILLNDEGKLVFFHLGELRNPDTLLTILK